MHTSELVVTLVVKTKECVWLNAQQRQQFVKAVLFDRGVVVTTSEFAITDSLKGEREREKDFDTHADTHLSINAILIICIFFIHIFFLQN